MSPQGHQYTAQDAPAALLPNGNVLFAVSGGAEPKGGGYSNPPVAFFEFDGSQLIPEPTIPNAAVDASGSINLLVLPSGQILATDSSKDVEIYTPDSNDYSANWAPQILAYTRNLTRGQTYSLTGMRLNGMSQGSAFGDEDQDATNYPLLRITNRATHHVAYARTHDFSSMAVASHLPSTMKFDVPAGLETGLSTLEVVTNGIPSQPVAVLVN